MANGVRNKLTPFCLKFIAARTITECEYQAIKLADHTHAYWMNQLNSGVETKEQVLVGFSESAENHINLIGVIQNGIALNFV